MSPTVLTDIDPDAALLQRGDLRPGRSGVAFSSDDEAIAAANDTEYGLVAYVFTRDLTRAF